MKKNNNKKDFANVCFKGTQEFLFLKKDFSKIEKILTTFLIYKKIFLKINSLIYILKALVNLTTKNQDISK